MRGIALHSVRPYLGLTFLGLAEAPPLRGGEPRRRLVVAALLVVLRTCNLIKTMLVNLGQDRIARGSLFALRLA